MPNIKVTGISVPEVKKMSLELSGSLSEAVDCPIDWLTFSIGATDGEIFCNGEILNDTVFIHVEWFDRGIEAKNSVAKIITDYILENEINNFKHIETVDVIFVNLEKSDYYENGEHF